MSLKYSCLFQMAEGHHRVPAFWSVKNGYVWLKMLWFCLLGSLFQTWVVTLWGFCSCKQIAYWEIEEEITSSVQLKSVFMCKWFQVTVSHKGISKQLDNANICLALFLGNLISCLRSSFLCPCVLMWMDLDFIFEAECNCIAIRGWYYIKCDSWSFGLQKT